MRFFHHTKARDLVWIAIGLVMVVAAGCGSLQLQSQWRTHAIVIDGNNDEWGSAMMKIEDKQLMVGLLNDSSYLYLSLVTTDQSIQRQIMFLGLTVWFDYQGGEEKRLGIHFPVGSPMGRFSREGVEGGTDERYGGEGQEQEGMQRNRMAFDTTDVEIMGPGEGEHRKVSIIELKELAVKTSILNGRLVYELKVPLADHGLDPYAIGTKAGAMIGVGVETGTMPERRPSEEPQGEGADGRRGRGGLGGGGRRGGGVGSGYGGARGQSSGQQREPLSIWAKVQLANGPVTSLQ